MVLPRLLLALALALPPMAVTAAHAGEAGNRLVAGGAGLAAKPDGRAAATPGELRAPLLAAGGFSLGGVAETSPSPASLALPFSSGRGNLAVGGYVSYGLSDTRLSSSLKSDGQSTTADISAAYRLGAGSSAALSLGSVWGGSRPQGFSPNPVQSGLAYGAPSDPAGNDLNLSLSLMHQVTPAFSVGGVAQANRLGSDDRPPASGLMFGAGLGYRF